MSLAEMPDLVLRARRYRNHDVSELMAYLNREAPNEATGLKALEQVEIDLLRLRSYPEAFILSVPEIEQALREEGGLDKLLDSDLSGLTPNPDIHFEGFSAQACAYLKWLALCEVVDRVSSRIGREKRERDNERRRLEEEQWREGRHRSQAILRLKEVITTGESLAGHDLEAEEAPDPEVVEITGATSREIESHRLTPDDADALRLFTGAAMRCRGMEPEDWSEADKAILWQRLERGTAVYRAVEKIFWFRDLRKMAQQRQTRDEELYDSWRDIGKELK